MIQTTKVSEDPLKDIQKKKILPLFATKCGINHFSPSQFAKPDASWLIEYVHFDQPTRRKILKPNAAMASGIAVGNVLQNVLADEIWKLNSARKLAPVKWTKLKKEESLQEEIEKYKDYEPTDDKDRTKHQKYLEEIPQLVSNGFKALEEIGLASPIICEKQISLTSDNAPTFCSPCSLACVGRTDFEFGSTVFGGKSPHETSPTTSVAFPQKLIELKTKYSRLGKIKKDGSRSFVKAAIPTTPSFNHLVQCAFYSSYYNFKVPMYLLYVVEAGYKIYNSNNCPGLTVEGLKQNFQIMMNVFRRREKILAINEDKSKEEIIAGAIDIMDPMFDHPYAWNNYPTDILQEIKAMWRMV